MMSVTANAGDAKPITVAAAANCRSLNADLTMPPLSLLAIASAATHQNSYIFYICTPRDRQDSSSFRDGPPKPTIDDHRGVGNS
jgi:hypothetical protein